MSMLEESTDDRIAEEAADWFGRIREGQLSNPDRKQFAQWLAESPVHVREYLGISETWGALHSAQSWPEQTSEQLLEAIRTAQGANIIPLKELSTAEGNTLPFSTLEKAPTSARRMRFLALAATVLLTIVGISTWFIVERDVYRTARGEQRSVVLPDGSVIQLNTLTKMVVHFDDGHRRIELPQGEAFFRVAHDAKRPFDVETQYAVVRAVGTEFNVYNRADSTRVAVVEGKVQVAPRAEGQSAGEPSRNAAQILMPKPIALGPKESLDVDARGRAGKVTRSTTVPATQRATAWMQRRIVLDNDRIDTAIAEFNRYNKLQMQVPDPELAALRISGVFSIDDPQALMKYLDQIQDVDVHDNADGFVLQRN